MACTGPSILRWNTGTKAGQNTRQKKQPSCTKMPLCTALHSVSTKVGILFKVGHSKLTQSYFNWSRIPFQSYCRKPVVVNSKNVIIKRYSWLKANALETLRSRVKFKDLSWLWVVDGVMVVTNMKNFEFRDYSFWQESYNWNNHLSHKIIICLTRPYNASYFYKRIVQNLTRYLSSILSCLGILQLGASFFINWFTEVHFFCIR